MESEELGAGWREPEIAWTDDSCDLVMVTEDIMTGTDRGGGYTVLEPSWRRHEAQ